MAGHGDKSVVDALQEVKDAVLAVPTHDQLLAIMAESRDVLREILDEIKRGKPG